MKKETQVTRVNIKYLQAKEETKIAKSKEELLKLELMELISQNETIANVKHNYIEAHPVDNQKYISHLISLLPKTKQEQAKEDREKFKKEKAKITHTILQIKDKKNV